MLGRAIGLLRNLCTGLHELVEGQGVADHDLILEHLGVVGFKRLSCRSVGHDLQPTFHRGEVVDDLAFGIFFAEEVGFVIGNSTGNDAVLD